MFERFTEKARRVIFFARYQASQFGSPYIETDTSCLPSFVRTRPQPPLSPLRRPLRLDPPRP
jgi:hypothetical protein